MLFVVQVGLALTLQATLNEIDSYYLLKEFKIRIRNLPDNVLLK